MRVVVATHYFPPIGGPGSIKIQGWARGWLEGGADVHVVTPVAEPIDPYYEPCEQPDSRISIHRVPIFDVSRVIRKLRNRSESQTAVGAGGNQGVGGLRNWLLLPDHRRTAVSPMARAVQALLRDRRDLLVTTSPYNSTHFVGLATRVESRTWLADFRDDWMHPTFFPQKTAFHRWYNTRAEGSVLSTADYVSIVAPQVQDRQSSRHPGIDTSNQKIIPNGAAGSRIDELLAAATVVEQDPNVFRIVYAGTLWDCHHIESALETYKLVAGELKTKLEVLFIGRVARPIEWPADSDYFSVRELGWMPYGDSLAWQKSANALLVHAGPTPESLATKMFDAMHLQVPLIWIGLPESQGADLMREHIAHPLIADDRDTAAMRRDVETLIQSNDQSNFAFRGLVPKHDRIDQGQQILRWVAEV